MALHVEKRFWMRWGRKEEMVLTGLLWAGAPYLRVWALVEVEVEVEVEGHHHHHHHRWSSRRRRGVPVGLEGAWRRKKTIWDLESSVDGSATSWM